MAKEQRVVIVKAFIKKNGKTHRRALAGKVDLARALQSHIARIEDGKVRPSTDAWSASLRRLAPVSGSCSSQNRTRCRTNLSGEEPRKASAADSIRNAQHDRCVSLEVGAMKSAH
jgi:hypothetical protein